MAETGGMSGRCKVRQAATEGVRCTLTTPQHGRIQIALEAAPVAAARRKTGARLGVINHVLSAARTI